MCVSGRGIQCDECVCVCEVGEEREVCVYSIALHSAGTHDRLAQTYLHNSPVLAAVSMEAQWNV